MAVQSVTATPEINVKTTGFIAACQDEGDGPGGTPQIDGRVLGGLVGQHLNSMNHIVQGEIAATADGNTDGIDVLLGFKPKLVLVYNLTQTYLYVKMATMTTYDSLRITGAPAVVYVANTIKMGNKAGDNENAFSIHDGQVALADAIHYVAMG